jgi:hypothetical protein
MTTVSAAVDIDAPPATVWAILTDLGSYREWNPLFVEAEGHVAVGERIRLRSRRPPSSRLMTVRPRITKAEPDSELCWVSSIPMIITGEHTFVLTAAGRGTRLVQAETFRGLLGRIPNPAFANAESSFQALNQALRARAEGRANGPAQP